MIVTYMHKLRELYKLQEQPQLHLHFTNYTEITRTTRTTQPTVLVYIVTTQKLQELAH